MSVKTTRILMIVWILISMINLVLPWTDGRHVKRGMGQSVQDTLLKDFYLAYIQNSLNNVDNAALCKSCMHKDLLDKLRAEIEVVDADPVIRAQDMNDDS